MARFATGPVLRGGQRSALDQFRECGEVGKNFMKLDEVQEKRVKEWVGAGLQPAEIQKRLADEFELRLTYMEVRFLLDDLRVSLKDKEPAPVSNLAASATAPGAAPDPAGGGGVKVSVDQITRAGAVVSGKVTFSDGKTADWYLDQAGRLGLAPQQAGYKPSQPDLLEFQEELQGQLSKLGF